MPKLTEKEILARLDEADAATLRPSLWRIDTMTDAHETAQALRDLGRQARVTARALEALRVDELAQADRVVADKEIKAVRAELADARAALEHERACRRVCENNASRLAREVERLKASEAASIERERKLTEALRIGGKKCAAAERARKVLIDQVAALHGWRPSDAAVKVAHGMLIHSGRSAIRSALRTAFVRDHLEACGCMREPEDSENTSKGRV